MKNKIITLIIIVIICQGFALAFLISDQGTNVREVATGNLTAFANLTIEIYDASTGGNLIYNYTLQNAISNGSWNVMINPNLEYGKSYYKDYQINSEDLDFDGNEILEFQSSVGKIHNISFINFSLINSCSAGSSIRVIYENGSVDCENDDSGSTEINLTNYALKNQSEIFTGNITTSQTGFFGWLGSLASRITKLFVQDIDASGNVNVTGNVTASYFIGDGSLLTGVSGGNYSWNQTLANTLYAGIIWNYNQSTPVFSYITSQEAAWLSTYNATYAIWSYNQTTPANSYTDTKVGTANLHLHNALNITSPIWVNKTGDSMTGNLNMTSKNVTSVDCIVFNSGGKICSG